MINEMARENKKKVKIAYLAPEIPALSATFVYNEILCLESIGFEVVPISVHIPGSVAEEDSVVELKSRTIYLYSLSKYSLIWTNLNELIRNPLRYLTVLGMAVGDAFKIGFTSHTGRGLLFRFAVASRVVNILRDRKCQHIHTHFAHIPTDIAMYASGMAGIPFSFTSHANDIFERGWLLREKVERSGFAVTISEFNREFLLKIGAAKNKIKVIHCGVDSRVFLKSKNGRISGVPKIGSMGRMVEKKGFEVLITACERLKDSGIEFCLELAGDGPLMEELQKLVDSLGLSAQVVFSGPIPHNQVSCWLRSLNLFVLACKRDKNGDMDGIPVVLMEAMLAGVPVVSTRVSGIPELIEENITGCLAMPEDPKSIEQSIRQILADSEFRSVIIANAITRVKSDFDLLKNVEKLATLFRR